jgi:hypothetical protein
MTSTLLTPLFQETGVCPGAAMRIEHPGAARAHDWLGRHGFHSRGDGFPTAVGIGLHLL